MHRRSWELILADPELRAEYEELMAADTDFAAKSAFFENVLGRLQAGAT
jgi:hypothetical protein